ncbi:MAG: NrsF family protein, partial [Pseudomonadota bacterium]
MSDKNLDSFIEGLADDLQPVTPLAHPLQRMAPLIIVCILYVAAMIAMIGPRDDFMPKMMLEFDYLFEILLSLSIFISSAVALGWMSIPDMRGQTWIKAVPVTLAGVFVSWAGLRA